MKNLSLLALGSALLTVIVLLTAQILPDDSSNHYAGSGVCAQCHDGLREPSGGDVSIADDWRSTMMANAARDPLWQVKVYSETTRNPGLAGVIEDKCATCHMPMARSELILGGEKVSVWGGNGLLNKEHPFHGLAMDGVSCALCHQISEENLASDESFSGHFLIDPEARRPDRGIFGPYPNPVANPMRNTVRFTPRHSGHVDEAGLCATCHTLFTPIINDQGQHVGDFPEQTPYLEWKNSVYAEGRAQAKSCQDCHMPVASGGIIISNRPPRGLTPRSPFFKHFFVGGNAVMLEFLSRYREDFDLNTSEQGLARTKERTEHQLQTGTADIEIAGLRADGRTLIAVVRVQNKTGHKFPTGFPSRRAWIHMIVTDSGGSVLFESGEPGPSGSIAGNDADRDPVSWEPHHTVIRDSGQVQIYEVIMGDLAGKVTYTLLEASDRLKDNRLLPYGFIEAEAGGDIRVVGEAREDERFVGGEHVVTYEVPLRETNAPYRLTVELLYQSVSYSFWRDLLDDEATQESSTGKSMIKLGELNRPIIVSSAENILR